MISFQAGQFTFNKDSEPSFSLKDSSHTLPLAVESVDLEEALLGVGFPDGLVILAQFPSKLQQSTLCLVTKMSGQLAWLFRLLKV